MLKLTGRKMVMAAVYGERYVLSLVYLYFAWIEWHTIWYFVGHEFLMLRLTWIEPPVTRDTVFAEVARHVVAFLLNFSTGIFLLLGRRTVMLPQKLRDIFVPLAAAFFVLTYDAVAWFPISIRESLCPHGWQIPLIFAGLLLAVVGPAVSVWAIFYLRRSFGVFVEVRKVVVGGPYQWVRHPMYLGYIGMLAGLLLANFSVVFFLLVPVHVALLVYRARLEEARLAEYSPEYRQYMGRTGFLFPKFRLAPVFEVPDVR